LVLNIEYALLYVPKALAEVFSIYVVSMSTLYRR
jgi:hypothetical protein